ncbi:hypothetical protein RRG08_008988, partial [Elysia crispata]
ISIERPSMNEWNLHIRDIRPSDQGVYRCQANTFPVQTKEVTLTVENQAVTEPPMGGTSVKATRSSTAVLPCRVEAAGNHRVIWLNNATTPLTLNDRRIIDDQRISIERPSVNEWNLHIRDIRPSDQGVYRCQANTFPVQTKEVTLTVESNLKVHFLHGEEYDDADYTGGGYVDDNENASAVAEGVQDDVVGEIEVIWLNNATTPLTLNDRRIIDDQRISVERPSMNEWNLQIRDIRPSDQGVYRCQANTFPVQTKEVTLTVESNLKVHFLHGEEYDDADYTGGGYVDDNENASAVAEGVQDDVVGEIEVIWLNNATTPLTLNDMRIIDDQRISIERPSMNEWNLHIRDIRPSDQGVYRCQANTFPVQTKEVNLTVENQAVTEPPMGGTSVKATRSSTAVLPCRVEAAGNHRVIWLNNATTPLTLNDRRIINDQRISIERPSVNEWNLHISDIRPSDQGVYRCQANTFPVQTKEVTLTVENQTVTEPPMGGTSVKATRSSTAVLPCRVEAAGNHRVIWLNNATTPLTLNDMRIIDDQRISIERPSVNEWNLHISDIRPSDQGVYRCQANTSPVQTKEVTLIVEKRGRERGRYRRRNQW